MASFVNRMERNTKQTSEGARVDDLECTIEFFECTHCTHHKIHPRFGFGDLLRDLNLPQHLEFGYYRLCPSCDAKRSRRCSGEVMSMYLWAVLVRIESPLSKYEPARHLLSAIYEELTALWWHDLGDCDAKRCRHEDWHDALGGWARRCVKILGDSDLRETYHRVKRSQLLDLGADDASLLSVEEADRVIEELAKAYTSKNPEKSLPWTGDL